MPSLVFFDSNILVYMDDLSSAAKRKTAIELVTEHFADETAVVSLQVLQEYFSVTTRKLGVSAELAQEKVAVFARGRVVRFEVSDVIAAIELHRLTRISFWDALIVHAARAAGAAVLYSEDLQHGSLLAGVRIVNPFANA
jgi:predicted nucleic acid-binding protein